ncbi:MAG: hypothetical protein AAF518_02635 [Spirochaetota bacterium]
MNKLTSLIVALLLAFTINCKEEEDNNDQNLALLYLASQNSSGTVTYGNTATGSSTGISGSYGTSSGVSSSVSTSFSSATLTSSSKLVEPSIRAQIQDQVQGKIRQTSTCTASTSNISGTVTTASTLTCLSGSAAYTPNVTFSGTYVVTCPTSTTSKATFNYTYTGSTEIVYSSCNLKIFDVKTYVDSGQQTYQSTTTTLTGTVSASNISGTAVSEIDSSTGQSTSNANSTSTITSSALSVDGGTASAVDITAKTITESLVFTISSSNGSFTVNYISGTLSFQNQGTINGESIDGSYTIDSSGLSQYGTAIASIR